MSCEARSNFRSENVGDEDGVSIVENSSRYRSIWIYGGRLIYLPSLGLLSLIYHATSTFSWKSCCFREVLIFITCLFSFITPWSCLSAPSEMHPGMITQDNYPRVIAPESYRRHKKRLDRPESDRYRGLSFASYFLQLLQVSSIIFPSVFVSSWIVSSSFWHSDSFKSRLVKRSDDNFIKIIIYIMCVNKYLVSKLIFIVVFLVYISIITKGIYVRPK